MNTALLPTLPQAVLVAYSGDRDIGTARYQIILRLGLCEIDPVLGNALTTGLIAGRVFQPGTQRVAVADHHFAAFSSLKPGGNGDDRRATLPAW